MSEVGCAYKMRGPWVKEQSEKAIAETAHRLVDVLSLKRRDFNKKNIGKLINELESYGINIDVVDDDEWPEWARATVDPEHRTIYMPNSLFVDLNEADPAAVRIYLHELGHIFLLHRPVLHFTELAPKRTQDAEWQADEFADSVIERLKLPGGGRQLEFKNF